MNPRWPEQTTEERFWLKVRKGPGCWTWQAATNNHGYGKFWIDGVVKGAHVVSYELANGPIGAGLNVCHHCDHPLCVRPDHLFAGTQAENLADGRSKGRIQDPQAHLRRMPERQPRGESHSAAKLTDAQVAEIRRRVEAGESQKAVGKDFPVSKQTISKIVRGERR